MNVNELKNLLISFADNQTDVDINKRNLLAVIRGETIVAELVYKDNELYIREDKEVIKVIPWIINRVANLHQLADRILDYTEPEEVFVNPSGKLLEDVQIDPTETETPVDNVTKSLIRKLGDPIPGTSNVIYLTSDAGEGKTTIINQLAIEQARNFKNKLSKWLIIPIPLGGRTFLRFDDIVVASLMNRLRFRLFYYDSFIELVKLGLIIPAFDGFEEMFMESSPTDALSTIGQLMSKLNSAGTVLIAARKAYFDYKSFDSQAKLFDSIGTSVSFSKLSINPWDKQKFLEYAEGKGINDTDNIYNIFVERLGEQHPLLTRPVLVSQLLNGVKNANDIIEISNYLEKTALYFPRFVHGIIQREAEQKWIVRSGEAYKPLLAIDQHYEILSAIAEEMWLTNTNSLPESVFDLISEIYCDMQKFSIVVSREVKERLKQHALVTRNESVQGHYSFDHDDYKDFFLGYSFAKKIEKKDVIDLRNLLRRASISNQTSDAVISYLKKDREKLPEYLKLLNDIQAGEGNTSFIKENHGALVIKLVNGEKFDELIIENAIFPANSLNRISLKGIHFINSYFQATTLIQSHLNNCVFENCTFDRIEYDPGECAINNSELKDCQVLCAQNLKDDKDFYDPYNIKRELKLIGFIVVLSQEQEEEKSDTPVELDEELELTEKLLRKFIRATYISDNIFRIRLGTKVEYFNKRVLPILLSKNILEEAHHEGGGLKRQFKLTAPLQKIFSALTQAKGSFQKFLEIAGSS
jgi:hypothetical protein